MNRAKKLQGFYKKLTALVGTDLKTFMTTQEYLKLESGGFMPLSIDVLGPKRISIAHNYTQNGDVMADPDMELYIDHEQQIAFPMTYQQDGLGVYQSAYRFDDNGEFNGINQKLAYQLESFLTMWLRNLKNQGFGLKKEVLA